MLFVCITSIVVCRNQNFDHNEIHDIPYLYNITTEPNENYPQIMGGKTNSTDDAGASSGDVDDLGAADDNHHNVQLSLGSDQKMTKYLSKAFKFIKPNHLMSREEYPAEINHCVKHKAHSQSAQHGAQHNAPASDFGENQK